MVLDRTPALSMQAPSTTLRQVFAAETSSLSATDLSMKTADTEAP